MLPPAISSRQCMRGPVALVSRPCVHVRLNKVALCCVSVALEESFRRLRRHRAPGVTGRRAEYLIALTHRFSDDRAASA